jgi:hypothetical protein
MSFTPLPGQSFKGALAFNGGNNNFVFTAAMGTTAQPIKIGGGRVCQITNTGSAAQSVTLSIYDSATIVSPGTNGTLLFTITPGSTTSQRNPTVLDIPFDKGLVVVASGAITGTVLVQYL